MTQLKSHTLRACYQHGRRLSSVQDITDFSLTLLGLWRTLLAVPVGSRWLAEISDVSPEYAYQPARRLSSVEGIIVFSLTEPSLWRTLLRVPVGWRRLMEISDVSTNTPVSFDPSRAWNNRRVAAVPWSCKCQAKIKLQRRDPGPLDVTPARPARGFGTESRMRPGR